MGIDCTVPSKTAPQQRGATLWFTGLSGAGKSTIAMDLEKELASRGYLIRILDGDHVRTGLNKNLGFSAQDRAENIRRISEVAKLFADTGFICIVSVISPYRADRAAARTVHEKGEIPFLEVYLSTPIAVCEQRDPKGLYKKARAGEIKNFTGIDDPYEAPESPDINLDTGVLPLEECSRALIAALEQQGVIGL